MTKGRLVLGWELIDRFLGFDLALDSLPLPLLSPAVLGVVISGFDIVDRAEGAGFTVPPEWMFECNQVIHHNYPISSTAPPRHEDDN